MNDSAHPHDQQHLDQQHYDPQPHDPQPHDPQAHPRQHRDHHHNVDQQFSSQAQAYLQSNVHATGNDLRHLTARLAELRPASVLDVGCGAGHASFIAAASAGQVIACDLSAHMLAVVQQTAQQRGLKNLTTRQACAESLPFAEHSFPLVISRYSAHHWQDVPQALREINRVLQPGGLFLLMDIMSPGYPLADIWLQTIEALRDTSHVRNYTGGEWLIMLNQAGLLTRTLHTDRLTLEFNSWIARMRTPAVLRDAIRVYQQSASDSIKHYFNLQDDGTFTSDAMMLEARKQ